MTRDQAEEIATLLNARNELTVVHTGQNILSKADNYRFVCSAEGKIAACVEIKKVQWYQYEVLHLTVDSKFERQGHAKAFLCEVERIARRTGARILQCTIREDNTPSQELFEGFGFRRVSVFFNVHSGNNVGAFQKVMEPAR